MKVNCRYNDPTNLPVGVPDDFDFGLELNKEYIVMGIATYKGSHCPYYLIDESGRPNWFPFQLFEVVDNSIPQNWFVKINGEIDNSDVYSIYGFSELCNDIMYYDRLIDRDEESMRIYYRRKVEYENDTDFL